MTTQSNVTVNAYFQGIEEGIIRFAYWKDGVQYVGTTGKTLSEALTELQREKEQFIERNQT